MTNTNPYKNTRVEFHILQSFPVTCLNRDDVGAPKTAVVGGVTRARVSSQCWKRQVRLELHNLGMTCGVRTKLIENLIANACEKEGATPEQAHQCGKKIEQIFIKKTENKNKSNNSEEVADSDTDNKTDTLLFLSPNEVKTIAAAFKANDFKADTVITQKDSKKAVKELTGILGKKSNETIDGLDIALFGRMVAQATELNVEAASSFSHAISTHKIANEVEFFTALDDRADEPGSAHMGSLEFNSATYYRYIGLDLGQLFQTLQDPETMPKAVEAFIKALYIAVPSARQTTQSGASPWEFAKVYVRKGQRLQVPFETAIKAKDGGFLQASINELKSYLNKKEKLSGSLFGKLAEFEFGENESFSIDDLIDSIHTQLSQV